MNEGRIGYTTETSEGFIFTFSESSGKDTKEVRVFTLAELEERDEEKFHEGVNFAKAGYDEGFAAGVEAAIYFCHTGLVWDYSAGLQDNVDRLISRIRAILPPSYKSPAEIRRKALEGAEKRIFAELDKWIAHEAWLSEIKRRITRALAEGGK